MLPAVNINRKSLETFNEVKSMLKILRSKEIGFDLVTGKLFTDGTNVSRQGSCLIPHRQPSFLLLRR